MVRIALVLALVCATLVLGASAAGACAELLQWKYCL